MKNSYCKVLAYSLFLFFLCISAHAQQSMTHTVKEGETLESISKLFKVTPYNIVAANKEVKLGASLSPGMVLLIPLDNTAVLDTTPTLDSSSRETADLQEEPIGFTSHKVRKRETLYSISKRYNIAESDLKRYNRELYSAQLKKGMRLRIPKYSVPQEVVEAFNAEDFEKYVVAPKETRWSIAHKYGISMDSLVKLNPELPKNSTHLAEGQELLLPKIKGSSIEQQAIQLYTSYTVPKGVGFYRLKEEYGVSAEEVMQLNPEIAERGGLKEGMVIRLPKKSTDTGTINTDNYIFYEVKPKQNEFRLTRKFGMSWQELIALNPDLAQGLKAGMILKLPKSSMGDFEVKNSLVLDKINLLDSVNVMHRPKLVFLLPFRLDKLDVNNTSNTRKAIERRNDVKYSLGLYTGALIALDSISKLGVSVDVKTYDNQLNLAKTKEILANEDLMGTQAVIGPLDDASLKEVAVQAAKRQVPVIAPISSNSELSLGNVFFSVPTNTHLLDRILTFVDSTRTQENIIVIADDEHLETQQRILERFPSSKTIAIKEEKKNISINIDKFINLLSEEQENWIFLETDNFKMVSSALSIINSNNTEETRIRLFTTDKNRAFDNEEISIARLSNLRFTYPSVYKQIRNDAFSKAYKKRFGTQPDRYASRGFDITYDLLLKLAYTNNLFQASGLVGLTEYTGNRFNYLKDFSSGYFNTASYIMMFDEMRIKEINL